MLSMCIRTICFHVFILKHTFHIAMQDQSNKWLFVRGRLFPPSLPRGAKFSNVLLCIVGLFAFTFVISIALLAQTVKSLSTVWEPRVDPWIRKISWRRKRQPTPVFLPGKPHGQKSLAGCSPWGCKDWTEWLHFVIWVWSSGALVLCKHLLLRLPTRALFLPLVRHKITVYYTIGDRFDETRYVTAPLLIRRKVCLYILTRRGYM